tara:strand:+ start:56050 stop:56610 length:561 start_codon:yes stop_codon:yes gene_type:complete
MTDENAAVEIEFVSSTLDTFQANKKLCERAVEQVSDELLGRSLHAETNSIAVIMKHIAGNLRTRWTDFLESDGEKPWRQRDDEFIDSFQSRDEVMECWESGWQCLFSALNSLSIDDVSETVKIRGVPHSVPLAIERSLGHTCYHIGQIVLIARLHVGDSWTVLTIPRGESEEFNRDNWGSTGKSHS